MVRKATINDAKAIFELIEFHRNAGEMLGRPLNELYSQIRDFFVYVEDGKILGACASHICWEDLAEIRSLAVEKSSFGRGIGTALVKAAIEEAKTLGATRVFALTYRKDFFDKLGFKDMDKEALPHKIWSDCVKCVKFPNCDESAVMLEI
ncbi:MAG: N-acetyltransferase [Deltaproteobacteria bacterium]|nr:N-acetyltransferase [Deltaproteobacteria bacterium]